MKNKQQLLTFYLLITTITTHGMNQIVEYSWYNVPTEVKIGLIARVPEKDKEKIRLVNKELSVLASTANLPQIIMHYPCILNRDTHLKFMIDYSRQMLDYKKQENKELLTNEKAKTQNVIACLIKNGSFCKHADVLDIVPYFFSDTATINYSTFENIPLDTFITTIIAAYKDNLYRQDPLSLIMPYAIDVYGANEVMISTYMEQYRKTAALTTHLHIAVEEGHTEIAELFVAQNPNLLYQTDAQGMVPLAIAAQEGNLEIITLLQKYSKRSKHEQKLNIALQQSPCFFAAQIDNEQCLQQLLTYNDDANPFSSELLLIATTHGNIPKLNLLLNHPKININAKNAFGHTALHALMYTHCNNKLEVLRLLLTKNPLLNEKDYLTGCTMLMLAVQSEALDIATLLLELPGIDINAYIDPQFQLLPKESWDEDQETIAQMTECKGLSTLCCAAGIGNNAMVELLLKKCASLTNNKRTPLMIAIQDKHYNIAKKIASHSPKNINDATADNCTALAVAIAQENKDMVEYLINHGAMVNNMAIKMNALEMPPLLCGVSTDNLEIVQLLVEKGADINYKTPSGMTAIKLAIIRKNLPIIEFLLKQPKLIVTKEGIPL